MVAVAGYLVGAVASVAIVWIAVGRRYTVSRDTSVDLGELGGRHVAILGALSGFAVTGLVLLVTLGRNSTNPSTTSFTTLLTMFVVAYMGYFATSIMFANVSHAAPTTGFDAPAAAYAGAAVTLYFTVLIGWLALRPLFLTFGLTRMADLAGLLLVGAAVGGYGLLAQNLHHSGVASGWLTLIIAGLGVASTLLFGLIVALFRLRSSEATLDLTVTAFIVGVIASGLVGAVPVFARHRWTARIMNSFGRYLILGYAQGTVVFTGFLLLSVLGLA